MSKCAWCFSDEHPTEKCQRVAGLKTLGEFGIVDHTTVEPQDAFDAVSLRMIGWRTYAGQLERLLREVQHAIPDEIQALNPDRHFTP